jgi:hypothetical protein
VGSATLLCFDYSGGAACSLFCELDAAAIFRQVHARFSICGSLKFHFSSRERLGLELATFDVTL